MKITVCIGDFCHINGSEIVIRTLQNLFETHNVKASIELTGSFCMRKCQEPGVSVIVNGTAFKVLPEHTEDFFTEHILAG